MHRPPRNLGRMKRDAPGDRTYAHVEMGNLVPGPGLEIPGVVLAVAPITARSYFEILWGWIWFMISVLLFRMLARMVGKVKFFY